MLNALVANVRSSIRGASDHLISWGRSPVRRLRDEDQHAIKLITDLLRRHWLVVMLVFLFNMFAAVFEGSTMSILAIALQTLAGEEGIDLATSLGQLGAIADNLRASLGKDGLFLLLVGLAVISQSLRSGLQFGGRTAAAYLHALVEGDLWSRIFRQFMAISYAQVSQYKIGDLVSYTEQSRQMGALIFYLNNLLSQLFISIAYIMVLLWLSWPMTLAALVAVLFFASPAGRIIRRVREMAREFIQASVALNERTIEFLQGLRLIRSFARQDYAITNVDTVLIESVTAKRRGLIWQATITPVMELFTTIGVAIFLIGGYLLLGDESKNTLPGLIAFLFVLNRMMIRVATINNTVAKINNLLPVVQRITEILRTDDKDYLVSGHKRFKGLGKRIEFNNVSLSYVENEHQALNQVSFAVPRGSMVAFVGESGAGKSTVFNLVLRLYDPTSGQILVDGTDLREFDLKTWRERIGTVSQDAFIFNASIRDNIAFGKLDATQEQIMAAAQAAHAHDFIMELADGYQTVIGERGYRLSGGQRQRIAIARAILRNPEILILDEATSALDTHSERLIQAALDELRSQRTVLAIAHRLSTITMADQILLLDRGRLVEQGTHEELLALNARYAHLWRLQSKSEQFDS